MSIFNVISRTFKTSAVVFGRGKRISPKNFAPVYLKGTPQFIARQLSDPYVKQRRIENYRCRSAFKLLEINEKHDILKPGSVVVDLGAAPGSWSQVVSEKVISSGAGLAIAVDLLRFPALENVHSITGDFTDIGIQQKITSHLLENNNDSAKVDVVLCDAAPKASGVKAVDQDNIVLIVTSAARFAIKHLKREGIFLFKLLEGEQSTALRRQLSKYFEEIKSIKPPASRKESAELYILCLKYKPFR